MGTLTEAARFALDSAVRDPLTSGIAAAAVAIQNEDIATNHHVERAALASLVLRNPVTMVEPFAWALSSNPTVVDKWTSGNRDGAIADFAFTISSVWNAVAGVGA